MWVKCQDFKFDVKSVSWDQLTSNLLRKEEIYHLAYFETHKKYSMRMTTHSIHYAPSERLSNDSKIVDAS